MESLLLLRMRRLLHCIPWCGTSVVGCMKLGPTQSVLHSRDLKHRRKRKKAEAGFDSAACSLMLGRPAFVQRKQTSGEHRPNER